ncbi:MAG: alpha/beta fold hydrolase [Candidatus Levybacteria bacterium]|nr:alpha/beta fold hydrolase [Candidatus Levybacteria bacterium]
MKKIILSLGILLAVGIILFILINNAKSNTSAFDKQEQAIASVTPMPFEELTIPALRRRNYSSELGELTTVSSNSEYTSYSTNYTSDGLKINGQLTIPKGDRPISGWGAIVFVHGYIPPSTYQTFQNYSSYVDYLARHGFVVFKIDLRGHGESEGEPGGAYYSADYIIDVLSARTALQRTDFVDPEKIGLWGHSMAGNVVLRSMAVMPEIPAGVIWGGAVFTYDDWKKYGIDDGSYQPPTDATNRQRRRQQLLEKYGQFDKESPFWSKFAATNYINDIKGAIQLAHAIDDNVVNIGYSRDLNTLLDSTPVVHELKEYPSGGHNFTGETFNQAMQSSVDFFSQTLK